MPPKQKTKMSKQSNKLKSKTLEKSRRKKSKSVGEDKPTKKGRPPKDSSRKAKKKVAHTKGFKKELNSRKAVLTALGRARETLEEKLERQAEDENNHLLGDQQSESNEQEGKLGRSSEGVTYAGSLKVENHDGRKQSKRLPSPQQSPKKAGFSKVSRKRKRKEDSSRTDINQYHYSHVMKLFERSVDLAQFNENTPLYPICRAWIKNQPHSQSSNQEHSPSPDSDVDVKDKNIPKTGNIYLLPPPIKTESDQFLEPRIPSPLPETCTRIDIHADPDKAPPPKELMSNHMARWKTVRNKWKETSRQNELRYSPSLIILKEMFDSQCKDS